MEMKGGRKDEEKGEDRVIWDMDRTGRCLQETKGRGAFIEDLAKAFDEDGARFEEAAEQIDVKTAWDIT